MTGFWIVFGLCALGVIVGAMPNTVRGPVVKSIGSEGANDSKTKIKVDPDHDVSGASLPNAQFSGIDFTGWTLRGTDLRGSDLRNCIFVDADLTEANLSGADLRGADLTGALLIKANLKGARLG